MTEDPIPGVVYVYDPNLPGFVAPGRPDLPAVPPSAYGTTPYGESPYGD